ncbi:endonuclease/exonuclease/phosphatase family protein [Streptomyces sp. NPDC054796]
MLAVLAVLVAALLLCHPAVPNGVGRLGSLLEALLPWLGLAVPVLFVLALLRRSWTALAAVLAPALAWAGLFGALLLPVDGDEGKGKDKGTLGITAVQHNVSDVNPDPVATAKALAAAGPQLIALEEVTPSALPGYEKTLASDYPHHVVEGTVGLWSKYPLTDTRAVDIRPRGFGADWNRGLRATARTPRGEVAVYVAHLPSVRVGAGGLTSGPRDESAGLLGAAVAAERLEWVLLLGDLNGTVEDRGLDPLTSRLNTPERGFAFSFPAGFPAARIDQVMARSGTVTGVRTLPATGSDHLPVSARVELAPR